MGKMHELLAVESSVTANFNRDTAETVKVFGRADLFTRTVARKEFLDADDAHLNITETKEITTTVPKRLRWFAGPFTTFVDLVLQKDKTNQKANADLVVEGKTLAEKVPATTLLMLESKLQEIRKVIEAAPTLPAGFIWDWDENEQLFRSQEPKVTFSTKKTAKPVVLYHATKEHPAQVKEVFEDVPVAKNIVDTWSGMLTSGDKAKLLGRVDTLLQACKKARQKANATEVEKAAMGSKLIDFLFEGVVDR